MIDVAGDGIQLTSWTDGVVFPLRPGKPPGERAWTQANSDDAWLVLDRNGDGVINDGSEMFGNMSPQPLPAEGQLKNGFAALAADDDDGNRVIGDGDRVFASLRLWQDKDHDGVSQPGELHTLPELGVAGLSLDYAGDNITDDHGNSFRYRTAVYGTPGSTVGMTAWDVWLTSPIGTEPKSTTLALPASYECRCFCPLDPLAGHDVSECYNYSNIPVSNMWSAYGQASTAAAAEDRCRDNAWKNAVDKADANLYCRKPGRDSCLQLCDPISQTCP